MFAIRLGGFVAVPRLLPSKANTQPLDRVSLLLHSAQLHQLLDQTVLRLNSTTIMETAMTLPEPFRSLLAAAKVPPEEREPHISALRGYVASAPSEDPNRVAALNLICETMESKFSQTNSLEDADASVQANKELLTFLQSTPCTGIGELSQAHHNLAVALCGRYELAGNRQRVEDVEASIKNGREAVSLATGSGNPELPQYLMLLGNLLKIRSENSHPPSAHRDIEEAVTTFEKAIESAGQTYTGLDAFYDRYGLALQGRYEHLGDVQNLDLAIQAHEYAEKQTTVDEDKGRCLSNLANARLRRFDHYGSVNDEELNRGVEESDKAVQLTPNNHHDRSGRLMNFANALQARFERRGAIQDLYRAVEVNRTAVSAARSTRPGHFEHAECLASLGIVFRRLFDNTKSMPHLVDSIAVHRECLSITPENDGNKGKHLHALGSCLAEKFRYSGNPDDFKGAVRALQDAIEQTPSGHSNQLAYKTTLGNAYCEKYQFDNQLNDLNECVRFNEDAVEQSKSRNRTQFRASCLTNLSNALFCRARVTKSTDDLNKAIAAQQEALQTEFAEADHPLRAPCLHNLGIILADRYATDKMNNGDDLIEAILAHIEASRIPAAQPSLRIKAARRAMHLLRCDDLIEAILAHIEASRIPTAQPSLRIKAGRRTMHLLRFRKPDLSADLMQEAVETLQLVSPVTLSRDDQQRELAEFAGLASRAAALTLEAGRSDYEALRLLELGHGVMTALQLGLRSDVQSIAQVDEGLASRFQRLRDELNTAPSSLLESIPIWEVTNSTSKRLDNRHAILEELHEVVGQIRAIPEFTNFMNALTADEMMKLAHQGDIVVFNIDTIRSDAFLVTKSGIRAIRLNNFNFSDVQKHSNLVRKLTESSGARKFVVGGSYEHQPDAHSSSSLSQILEWLWDAAVNPVLTELGIVEPLESLLTSTTITSKLPKKTKRIWWVTSGWLSILPIHAAGTYRLGLTTNALDMVVSSYAPTLKSLWHARETELLRTPPRQALLISMKDTPGQPLIGAEIEISNLNRIIPSHVKRMIPTRPTKDGTLQALQECQICHFACHGESHASNPSRSRLILTDPENPLTVGDIAKLDLSGAHLAYLSACFAADNKVGDLLDEDLHLAAAFLLAGFPSVIGTLWCIRDLRSAEVAKNFYRGIVASGGEDTSIPRIDTSRSAESLNMAVRILKKEMGDRADPAIWAPYIHLGI